MSFGTTSAMLESTASTKPARRSSCRSRRPDPDDEGLRPIRGKAKPDEVIETAEKAKLDDEDKNEALFYAHLYVGLNYEAEGDAKKCIEHLTRPWRSTKSASTCGTWGMCI